MLQVALDVLDLNSALRIARECVKGGVDIIEAGTPLIKSVGMKAVRRLREEFPSTPLVADMKTMDTGYLEASMAAKAGADITTVLGVAEDVTILEAIRAARDHRILVEVDLIGHAHPIKRISRLAEMNVDIICLHTGIDVQKELGISIERAINIIVEARKTYDGIIAVAGGINVKTIGRLVEAGANILIVGSAITKSPNPMEASLNLKKEIEKSM